jgi:plasmid stabilization system protein ParE
MAKSKDKQLWHIYVSDERLEDYIRIFEGMLERWNDKRTKQQGEAYRQTLETRLQELYQIYEERTS